MVDREKVIKGFTRCQIDASCAFCPYSDSNTCITDLYKDVLELLKEQQKLINDITQRRANNGAFD